MPPSDREAPAGGGGVIFIFLDGVGIGMPDPDRNPFFRSELPGLRTRLGRIPSLDDPVVEGALGTAFPMDATMGVEGRPQSGTGQFTLLTGVNGARAIGRHFGPWTPTALRPTLEEANVFRRVAESGRTTAFANAYPSGFAKARWFKRPAPVPLAAYTAGMITRNWDDIAAGRALANGITNQRIRDGHRPDLPDVTPGHAGEVLARIGEEAAFTFFAHYGTDTAGHRGDPTSAREALERVDAFLDGVLDARTPTTGVLVTSDHGNIESLGEGHTRNPALGIWFPPKAPTEPRAAPSGLPAALEDVVPWLLGWFDSRGR